MCQLCMDITDPGYQFAATKRTFIFTNASENLATCGNLRLAGTEKGKSYAL